MRLPLVTLSLSKCHAKYLAEIQWEQPGCFLALSEPFSMGDHLRGGSQVDEGGSVIVKRIIWTLFSHIDSHLYMYIIDTKGHW